MGNPYSKYVKIDLYKWSSSEFPQEYALVYTSLDDPSRTTTLRFSVNTDMVLCGVADHMCKDHPARNFMRRSLLYETTATEIAISGKWWLLNMVAISQPRRTTSHSSAINVLNHFSVVMFA